MALGKPRVNGDYVLLSIAGLLLLLRLRTWWDVRRYGDFARLTEPRCRAWLDRVAAELNGDAEFVQLGVLAARDYWTEDREKALKRLRIVCDYLEGVVQPQFRETLAELWTQYRRVRVIAPPRALAVAAWRLWPVRGLAGLTSLATWVLVTGKEKLYVRLRFLGLAARVVWRTLLGTALLAGRDGRWRMRIEHAGADVGRLHAETLASAEIILAAVVHWEQRRAGGAGIGSGRV